MKCPILSAPTARTAFQEHFADVECLQKECAWWDDITKRCSMLTIGRNLAIIFIELHKLNEVVHCDVQARR